MIDKARMRQLCVECHEFYNADNEHKCEKYTPQHIPQVGGVHYGGTQFQHWDFVAIARMGYFEGNATKYICRAFHKGQVVEDLTKALSYIDKLIELEKAGLYTKLPRPDPLAISTHFYKLQEVYKLGRCACLLCRVLATWNDWHDLCNARWYLLDMLASAGAAR